MPVIDDYIFLHLDVTDFYTYWKNSGVQFEQIIFEIPF